jgi:hypothetical protein
MNIQGKRVRANFFLWDTQAAPHKILTFRNSIIIINKIYSLIFGEIDTMLHVKKITILTYAHIPARMKTLKYLQLMKKLQNVFSASSPRVMTEKLVSQT